MCSSSNNFASNFNPQTFPACFRPVEQIPKVHQHTNIQCIRLLDWFTSKQIDELTSQSSMKVGNVLYMMCIYIYYACVLVYNRTYMTVLSKIIRFLQMEIILNLGYPGKEKCIPSNRFTDVHRALTNRPTELLRPAYNSPGCLHTAQSVSARRPCYQVGSGSWKTIPNEKPEVHRNHIILLVQDGTVQVDTPMNIRDFNFNLLNVTSNPKSGGGHFRVIL